MFCFDEISLNSTVFSSSIVSNIGQCQLKNNTIFYFSASSLLGGKDGLERISM